MSAYPIEKNCPLPAHKAGKGTIERYPFRSMEVGDCFFVPATDRKPDSIRRAASRHSLMLGMVFKTLPMKEGAKVWRIE